MTDFTDSIKYPKTWREFKEAVEKHLKEYNLPEEVPLDYVDVTFPCAIELTINGNEEGISIT